MPPKKKKKFINPKTGQISIGEPRESLGATQEFKPAGAVSKKRAEAEATASARPTGQPSPTPKPTVEKPGLDPRFRKPTAVEADAFRVRQEAQQVEQQAAFQQQTGAPALKTELQEKIINKPDLTPEPVLEKTAEAGLAVPITISNLIGSGIEKFTDVDFEQQSIEELAETKFGKVLGNLITATSIVAAVGLAAPIVAGAVANSAIVKTVTGVTGSIPGLNTAIAGLGLYAFGGKVLDYEGQEMEEYRKQLRKVVEDGERIEAMTRNGYPTGDTIEILTTMSDEIAFAESRIQELGIYNVQYRSSKEYITDSQSVRSAREALLRRVLAVENIALTGQAAVNPEQLIFQAAELNDA